MMMLRPVVICLMLLGMLLSIFSFPDQVKAQPLSQPEAVAEHLPEGFHSAVYNDSQGTHRYTVYVPKSYSPETLWPVVLFLHGAGEKGNDGYLPLAGGLAGALERNADAPFIAVFPQCENVEGRSLTGWSIESNDGQRALAILEQVEKQYSIDSKKRILTGWSMGGYGAWNLAAARPELWSSVLAIAGGETEVPLDLKGLSEHQVPVWAIHGKTDALIDFKKSAALTERLKGLGGRASLSLVENVGHDIWRKVFASPDVLKWLVHPDQIDPQQVDFNSVTPLPARTAFYRDHLVNVQRIPAALGVRLGNRALAELAKDLAEQIPRESLSGTLEDIKRSFPQNNDTFDVTFSEIDFDCQVSECRFRAISGGRLKIEIDVQPLRLNIGHTTLSSRQHYAETSEISIEIGRHRPATLELEVQPSLEEGILQLRLLRQQFLFEEANWYIHPPEEVFIQSETFRRRHVVSGIVGSLYQSRQELVDEVFQAIPEILEQLELKLQAQDAPQLARILSPLPVLVPDIQVTTANVLTDRHGICFLLDMNVFVRGNAGTDLLNNPLTLHDLQSTEDLELAISLEAVTSFSQFSIDQGLAQVNMLDISGSQFQKFADAAVVRELFPEAEIVEDSKFQAVLKLLDPVRVSAASDSGDEQQKLLVLESSKIAMDFWQVTDASVSVKDGEANSDQSLHDQSGMAPVGRIVFSLSQPVRVETSRSSEIQTSFKVIWLPDCTVADVKSEALHEAGPSVIDQQAFINHFREAWLSWSQEQSQHSTPDQPPQLGQTRLLLQSFEIEDQKLNLLFKAQRVSARPNN